MRKNSDKKRKIHILPKSTGLSVAMLITILIQELFIFMIMILDVLPAKYAILLIFLLVIVDAGVFKLLNNRKKASNKRLVGLILSIALVNVLLLGCSYLYNTVDTFQKISSNGKQIEEFHVIVIEESKYAEIKEIEGKTVYVVETESKMHNEAKQKLLTKVDVDYQQETNAADVSEHIVSSDGKLNDEIIMLSNSNYEMMRDENKEFRKNTKILYSVSVAVKSDDFAKRINVTEDPFNIYISGIDMWGSIDQVSRSDVNMIVTVNPVTKEILLTSIPRDSYVTLHSYGQLDKLTHSGIYGIDETIMTVEDWLGVDINYYVRANFTMVVDLIDAIGGITVDSKFAFKSKVSRFTYVVGENEMDGEKALYFARERKAFEEQDEERGRNQQLVLKAVLNKITRSEVILAKYTDILNAVEGSMETNLSDKEISSLVKMQLDDMSKWKIKTISIDGDDAYRGTFSMGMNRDLFVSITKPESIDAAVKKIHAVMYPADSE